MNRPLIWALIGAVVAATPGMAQRATLMRCTATGDAACLAVDAAQRPIGATLGGRTVRVVGASPLSSGVRIYMMADPSHVVDFGRGVLAGRFAQNGAITASRWLWKPPLVSPAVFHGIVDSAAVPRDLLDAMNAAGSLPATRPIIGGLVFLLLAVMVVFLPRVAWGDPAGLAPPPRPLVATTTVTELPERSPRSPDDITLQTARRTALGR
jgi:hypothetical protein